MKSFSVKPSGRKWQILGTIVALFAVSFASFLYLENSYKNLTGLIVLDRSGNPLPVKISKNNYTWVPTNTLPASFKTILLQKEDQYFEKHIGFSVPGVVRSFSQSEKPTGSSTITQQLVKVLLSNEQDRNLFNKILETLGATALEIFTSKEEILSMYANLIYLGNNIQGFETSAQYYFQKPLAELSQSESLQIIATLSKPSISNPSKDAHIQTTNTLAARLNLPQVSKDFKITQSSFANFFELEPYLESCDAPCKTTIDADLQNFLRSSVLARTSELSEKSARNAAAIVISKTGEVLAMVGSPDPNSLEPGTSINMLHQPRASGSTLKPFIYTMGWEKGLRPYTLVDDSEHRFTLESGYALYPQNYDGEFSGEVSLAHALSNSLNIPATSVLEFVGSANVFQFLTSTLGLANTQDQNQYNQGIALGGFEITLFGLAQSMSVFMNEGELVGAHVLKKNDTARTATNVFSPEYVQLTNSVLSDASNRIEQFGTVGNLSIPQSSYSVKTGTSQNFKDSWTVGWTSDYLVAVWMGNAHNGSMNSVTGQSGAGSIWNDVMSKMYTSQHHLGGKLPDNLITRNTFDGVLLGALPADNTSDLRNLLLGSRQSLIKEPFSGDVILLEENTTIPLRSDQVVSWSINGEFASKSKEYMFAPAAAGEYKIKAAVEDQEEEVILSIVSS